MKFHLFPLLISAPLCFASIAFSADSAKFDYRVLATTKTSTMEKELNQAAEAGYVYSGVMGGETAFGGKEVVVIMIRKPDGTGSPRHYKLLATNKTSTLQKELQAAGDEGFNYCGQTIFESAFGGREVSVILEQSGGPDRKRVEYKVLATSKTGTLQKELQEAGEGGYEFLGVMVGPTAFGGREVVSILRR